MAYCDSIKIGGTIKQVQVVQELNALPSPVLETSPQLVKIGNDLYMRESKMGGLYGTYRFMLVPTNQQVFSVAFVSNGQTFGEIIINASGEMTYNNTLVYSNGSWVNENYKTIAIFDGNFNNALASFLNNNTEKIISGYFKYIKVSSEGGAGTTIIDITGLDEIPTQYQDAELLKTAILFDVDHLLRLTWIDDMYYYGNTDDFQYRYLSVGIDDFIIMRYDLQDIAKAPKIVNLNDFVPKTATQGTLERGALNVLQASNENYIVFNDEIFRLADKQHNAGYLVYSHVGSIGGETKIKTINLTIATGGWILTETPVSSRAITITNSLPEANEENFEKGKIYTEGELLKYISKITLSEPNISLAINMAEAKEGASAAAVGSDIYIFGGYNGSSYTKTIYKYNTISNSITTLSTTLPALNTDASAVAVGTNIYIFGGRSSGSTFTKTIYKFDTTTETITTLSTTMAYNLANLGAILYGRYIYLFGGDKTTSAKINNIYKFDTTTETITQLSTTIPTSLSKMAIARVENRIYLFGGEGSSNSINNIYKFDTTTETITTLTATLPSTLYSASAVAVGTNIYIFGGYYSGYSTVIYKFDTTTETITTLTATLPTGISDNPTILVGDIAYLIGGLGTGVVRLSTIYKAAFGFTYQYKTITAE